MKGYVGKTDRPQKRLNEHLKDKRARKCRRKYWLDSLVKRGLKPAFIIIDEVRESEGYAAEAAYIAFFLECGYELVNSTPGGDSGPSMLGTKHSAETISKMRETRRGEKNPNFGKLMSEEQKTKISAALAGKKLSPERIAKMVGRKATPEACRNCRNKKSGSSSDFHGVFWHADRDKWGASICINKKRKSLGRFANEVEAAHAYDAAAKVYHGAHAVLNFPD